MPQALGVSPWAVIGALAFAIPLLVWLIERKSGREDLRRRVADRRLHARGRPDRRSALGAPLPG